MWHHFAFMQTKVYLVPILCMPLTSTKDMCWARQPRALSQELTLQWEEAYSRKISKIVNTNKCYEGKKQGDIMENNWKITFRSLIGECLSEDTSFEPNKRIQAPQWREFQTDVTGSAKSQEEERKALVDGEYEKREREGRSGRRLSPNYIGPWRPCLWFGVLLKFDKK